MKWRRKQTQNEDAQPTTTPEEREAKRREQASAEMIREAVKKDGVWFPPTHRGAWIPWGRE